MRLASVLIITLRGIATEVCKNIVLAGIGKVTILDDTKISEEDLGCGFFFREEDVGKMAGVPNHWQGQHGVKMLIKASPTESTCS